jgi:hypothetical protein
VHPDDLPTDRPATLELTTVTGHWFRFDVKAPAGWAWTPFPSPRHRFDSISGSHRLRYAATMLEGAARERFDATGRIVSIDDGEQWVIELAGTLQVIDLRLDDTLDALGLDDRVNTGRLTLDRAHGDGMLDTCGTLTDRLATWFGDDLHGIVYRSRTTPQRSTNLAFYATAPLTVESTIRLRQLSKEQLATLVVLHGFHFEDESLLDR